MNQLFYDWIHLRIEHNYFSRFGIVFGRRSTTFFFFRHFFFSIFHCSNEMQMQKIEKKLIHNWMSWNCGRCFDSKFISIQCVLFSLCFFCIIRCISRIYRSHYMYVRLHDSFNNTLNGVMCEWSVRIRSAQSIYKIFCWRTRCQLDEKTIELFRMRKIRTKTENSTKSIQNIFFFKF